MFTLETLVADIFADEGYMADTWGPQYDECDLWDWGVALGETATMQDAIDAMDATGFALRIRQKAGNDFNQDVKDALTGIVADYGAKASLVLLESCPDLTDAEDAVLVAAIEAASLPTNHPRLKVWDLVTPTSRNLLYAPVTTDLHLYVAQAIREGYQGVQLADSVTYNLTRVPVINPRSGKRFILQGGQNSIVKFQADTGIAGQNWTAPLFKVYSGDVTIRNCIFDMSRTSYVPARAVVDSNHSSWMDKFMTYADRVGVKEVIDRFVFEYNTIIDSSNSFKPLKDGELLSDNWAIVLKHRVLADESTIDPNGVYVVRHNVLDVNDMELEGGSKFFRNIEVSYNTLKGGVNHTGAYIGSLDKGNVNQAPFTVETLRYHHNLIRNFSGSGLGIGNDSTNQSPYNFADARIHDNRVEYATVPSQFTTMVLLKLYRDPGTFRIYRNVIDAANVSPELTNLTFGPRSMGPRNGSWGEDNPTGTLLFERPSLVNAAPNQSWGLSLPQQNLDNGWGTVTEFSPWVDE